MEALGHVGLAKDVVLAAAACSWGALATSFIGVKGFRLTGYADHAAAFLVVATLTRLSFTMVETRWQIVGVATVASLYAIGEADRAGPGPAAGRWAASLAGILVGAVVTREIVHHYLERWL